METENSLRRPQNPTTARLFQTTHTLRLHYSFGDVMIWHRKVWSINIYTLKEDKGSLLCRHVGTNLADWPPYR
jgi:hypothetical protein